MDKLGIFHTDQTSMWFKPSSRYILLTVQRWSFLLFMFRVYHTFLSDLGKV